MLGRRVHSVDFQWFVLVCVCNAVPAKNISRDRAIIIQTTICAHSFSAVALPSPGGSSWLQ